MRWCLEFTCIGLLVIGYLIFILGDLRAKPKNREEGP
jgi:hypothetical protein